MAFDGFVPPVDDYFRMPNEWINICAEIDSLAEMKIVQYVLRHTWGYQGFNGSRKITIDEFMHGRKRKDGSRIDNGTGLSKQSVITGTGLAIEHGYLKCDTDKKDMARQKKYYQLAMKSDVKPLDTVSDVKDLDIQSDVKNLDISGVKNLDPDVKHLDSDGQEFRQRSEKDTLERHSRKTLERQEGVGSSEPTAPANVYHIQEKRQRRGDTDKHKAVKIGDTNADTLPVDIPDSPGSSTGDDAVSQEQEASQERQQALTASSQRAATEKAAGQSELNTPKRKGKRVTQAIEPEAVRIMDDWDSLFKRPSPRTDNHIKAAESLIASSPTKEDLDSVRKFCFSSNPEWYRNKGVSLTDVSRNFDKWQSLQEEPIPITSKAAPSNGINHERNAQRSEALKKDFEENGPRLKGVYLRHG